MEEVQEVVKFLEKDKAPGPNDFTVLFFQETYPILGKDILEVVEESQLSK